MKSVLFTSTLLAAATAVSAQDLSNLGRWSIMGNSGVVCIHTALLPNNRILCMERPHTATPRYPVNPYTDGKLVTEIKLAPPGQTIPASDVTALSIATSPFCAGHAQLEDGSLYIAGGDMNNAKDAAGRNLTQDGLQSRRVFNPCADSTCATGSWKSDASLSDMSTKRWYPTITTLSDGSVIVVGGSTTSLDLLRDDTVPYLFKSKTADIKNPTYEYYPPKTGAGWANGTKYLKALDAADPYNLYPHVYQLHNGKILVFSGIDTDLIEPTNDNVDDATINTAIIEKNKLPWIYPFTPTSVVLPYTEKNGYKTHIMVCGGSTRYTDTNAGRTEATGDNRCIDIDFANSNPQWTQTASNMPRARVMPDMVLMPDGQILVLNGVQWGIAGGDTGQSLNGRHPEYEVDIYNPLTKKWGTVARKAVPRLYHSGALLLPDGRVLTQGSDMQNFVDIETRPECFPSKQDGPSCTDPFEYRLEVFEPPYMFAKTERPVIANAPKSVPHASYFTVKTSTDATKITKISFIRYSTVTHSTNSDQRFVELRFQIKDSSTIFVESPKDGFIAPPGNWMLFILRDGIPSVSATINLSQKNQAETITDPAFDKNKFTPGRDIQTGPVGGNNSGAMNICAGVSGFLMLAVVFMF